MANANDFVDYTDFPNNVVLAIAVGAQNLVGVDPECVFLRPLRQTDPDVSIGVVATGWSPTETEIGSPRGPTVSTYTYAVQSMVKHADAVLGLAAHAVLSKRVRRMLDNVTSASLSLGQLMVTDTTSIERTQRFQITRQQFLSNEISNSFVFIAALEFFLETETVSI